VLANSEVDRRFIALVAELNLSADVVDAFGMHAAEPQPNVGQDVEAAAARPARMRAMRSLAAVTAILAVLGGVALATVADAGAWLLVAWFAVVVPGATLAAILAVEVVRNRARSLR
jgi:hypothetical protein